MFKKQAEVFKYATHYMLDFETLGVDDNPVLTQVGMTKLMPTDNKKLEIVDKFSERIEINSQLPMGRTIRPDTIDWWGKQDPDVFKHVFYEGSKASLLHVIQKMDEWYRPQILSGKPTYIWANGALADTFWLKNAYKCLKKFGVSNLDYPFNYNQEKCFRTMIFGLKDFIYKKYHNDAKHDALADAIWQSSILIDFINNLDAVTEEMNKFYNRT